MTDQAILDQIIALARAATDTEALAWDRAHAVAPDLVSRAEAAFDSWEQALAAALVTAVRAPQRAATSVSSAQDDEDDSPSGRAPRSIPEPDFERVAQKGWDGPIAAYTTDGYLVHTRGEDLATAHELPAPLMPFGEDPRGVEVLLANPREDTVLALSERGLVYAINGRVIPWLDANLRRPSDISGLASDERVTALMLREDLRAGFRFVHVTTAGKIKASAASDLVKQLDPNGAVALLLDDGDAIATAFVEMGRGTSMFCANVGGNGIRFDLEEVRTMGLRARGVKAMTLEEFDAVADAFATASAEHFVVISAHGLGKRIAISEFRTQGRGGQGMILMRPPRHLEDEIAAVVPVNSRHEDILIGTLGGYVARIAVGAIPLMGRPQSGVPLVELAEGDRVYAACRLPGSGPPAE